MRPSNVIPFPARGNGAAGGEGDAQEIVRRCEALYADLALQSVRDWKAAHPGRPAVGLLPIYAPRELVHAAGALPVCLLGGGDQIDIVKGDACFQSYICHLPRSTVELGLGGHLEALDGFVFPSTCDVIRNLSGIWQLLFPGKYVRYLDLPQAIDDRTGGTFYRRDLEALGAELGRLAGRGAPSPEALAASIRLFDENRRELAALGALRAEAPWLVPFDEAYLVLRAGALLDVEAHTALVRTYREAAFRRKRKREDRIRVVVVGAFCEQPPLGLLRTLERSGCYAVDDDLFQGARWIEGEVGTDLEPYAALARAYLHRSGVASTRYQPDFARGEALVRRVRALRADGVIFAAPSFCDPALLDQPPLQKALSEASIPFITFKYAENGGQFQTVREQAGTFSDSIKLWGEA